jgi:hypothetical protein
MDNINTKMDTDQESVRAGTKVGVKSIGNTALERKTPAYRSLSDAPCSDPTNPLYPRPTGRSSL